MSPRTTRVDPRQESLLERKCAVCDSVLPPYIDFVSKNPRRIWNTWCARCLVRGRGSRSRKQAGLGARPKVERLDRKRRLVVVEDYPADVQRPRTRADCIDGPRPCGFVSCRHHLLLDTQGARIKVNFPEVLEGGDVRLELMRATCALDVADEGGTTLEEVSSNLNVTRERGRQIQEGALRKVAVRRELAGYQPEDYVTPAHTEVRRSDAFSPLAHRLSTRKGQTIHAPRDAPVGLPEDDDADSSARHDWERAPTFAEDGHDSHWSHRLYLAYESRLPPKEKP